MYLATERYGLGDVTPGQAVAIGGAATNIAATAMSNAPLSTKVESGIATGLLTGAMFPSPAAPFLAVAGVAAEMLAAFGVGSGCGQSCVLSTAYANKAEQVFQQNIGTYFGLAQRYYSAQQAAIGVFNAIWNDLLQQCSNSSLGSAGQRCITDRQRGACKWKATADSPWPGGPKKGECWNWFNAYLDPIANDPGVVPDPTPASVAASGGSDLLSSLESGSSSNLLPLLAIGGLVALAVAL
jgi:hypothetical protein